MKLWNEFACKEHLIADWDITAAIPEFLLRYGPRIHNELHEGFVMHLLTLHEMGVFRPREINEMVELARIIATGEELPAEHRRPDGMHWRQHYKAKMNVGRATKTEQEKREALAKARKEDQEEAPKVLSRPPSRVSVRCKSPPDMFNGDQIQEAAFAHRATTGPTMITGTTLGDASKESAVAVPDRVKPSAKASTKGATNTASSNLKGVSPSAQVHVAQKSKQDRVMTQSPPLAHRSEACRNESTLDKRSLDKRSEKKGLTSHFELKSGQYGTKSTQKDVPQICDAEEVRARRITDTGTEYYVKHAWGKADKDSCEWIPEAQLNAARKLIKQFEKRLKDGEL